MSHTFLLSFISKNRGFIKVVFHKYLNSNHLIYVYRLIRKSIKLIIIRTSDFDTLMLMKMKKEKKEIKEI